jgi:hypothetical protein
MREGGTSSVCNEQHDRQSHGAAGAQTNREYDDYDGGQRLGKGDSIVSGYEKAATLTL